MDKFKFGSYIKQARLNKGYTQQQLADLLFIHVSAVSKWERGVSYPDITLVPDICRILDISEHELIESGHDIEYRRMKKDSIKYNNMKKGTFWTLNICYAIALLVCFIVNLAVSHTLSWFFIVFSSLICAYSFCPTITWLFSKNKNVVFIGTTFISLFLLFLTCSIYTKNYWFMIATMGLLLAYFIAFYPVLFYRQKLYFNEEKYKTFSKWFLLTYSGGVLALIILLLISIYFYVSYNLLLAILISGGIMMFPIMFGFLNLFSISKTLNKPILLSLVGIVIILILVALARCIYLKNTAVSKVYNIEETYNDIEIIGKNFDVNIYLSQDNENKVVYVENKKVTIDTNVNGGTLRIIQQDNRKFYDMLFGFNELKVDLYLNQSTIDSLDIKNKTGDIVIGEGFIFNRVNIENSTGDVEFYSDNLTSVNIKTSTGDVEFDGSNIAGDLSVESSTGSIELDNVTCTKLDIKISTGDTDLTNVIVNGDFNMQSSTGDLKFDGFDALNIYVNVSTGNVKGTLLSSKIFIVKSDTGRINVPETLTGGVCKITTSTGNININYK